MHQNILSSENQLYGELIDKLQKGGMTCLSSQNGFLTLTLLRDTLEIKPDRWNVFSSQKRQAFDSCVKTAFPCTAPLKEPSIIKCTLVSASTCKVVLGIWRVENKNLHHTSYVLTSEMRKGTISQLLLVSCTVSCKSLHLNVSTSKSFNWCLGIFMAAEDLWAKGLVLIHQQGIQSEEAWVQREANWAGRSLSDEPWVGLTVGWLQNPLVNVVVLMELRQTLPQPSISTGHRAVGEASESSAFCHPGSHCLLGCKLSVHLMWLRLCPELGCWVM